MSRVQIIRTPGGERLAVLPVEDYEALLEAASDDLAPEEEEALTAEMRRLRESDSGEGLPVEEFRRILAGESAVKVWREHRGLTAAELAKRAGISPEEVEMAETSPGQVSMETLGAVARGVEVDLEELIPPD